jgi:DNA polymerase III subunit epsilon
MTVCFTGVVTYTDGVELTRESLARIAQTLNLRVVDSVTKKGCDLLVAADPSSLSGKTGKARQYGIPIVDARDFLCADVGGTEQVRGVAGRRI